LKLDEVTIREARFQFLGIPPKGELIFDGKEVVHIYKVSNF